MEKEGKRRKKKEKENKKSKHGILNGNWEVRKLIKIMRKSKLKLKLKWEKWELK